MWCSTTPLHVTGGANLAKREERLLRRRRERTAHETLARALRQLDPFLHVGVLLALALAGVRSARAIVLAGLRHAVALLGGRSLAVIRREGDGARQHYESADGRREEGSLAVHLILQFLKGVGVGSSPIPSNWTGPALHRPQPIFTSAGCVHR